VTHYFAGTFSITVGITSFML